ncbi:MAG: AAA family ATPase, partial [Magnetococcales bacterium]|nr:AAA family ATPase [Magnetococcales bacterium]
MSIHIRRLKIVNFRSIDELVLENIPPYAVFVGPNGAGKSNFFEALDFVSQVIRHDARFAIQQLGGFDNVHCYQREGEAARCFEFYIETETPAPEVVKEEAFNKFVGVDDSIIEECSLIIEKYSLKIHQLDNDPILEELWSIMSDCLIQGEN